MFPVDVGCLGLRLMDPFPSLTAFGQAFTINDTISLSVMQEMGHWQ